MPAATTPLRDGATELVSPELALVDAELAASLRPLLPDPGERDDPQTEAAPLNPHAQWEAGTEEPARVETEVVMSEARDRLMWYAVDGEPLGPRTETRRCLRRRATLVPSLSAASAVALFLTQLYTSQGTLS